MLETELPCVENCIVTYSCDLMFPCQATLDNANERHIKAALESVI